MGSFGGFYKGEKKKPKKNKDVKQLNSFGDVTPTYVMPEVITKKRTEEK